MSINWWFEMKTFFVLDGVLFYLAGIFSGIFLFQLAKVWSEVLEAFAKVDSILHNGNYAHATKTTLKMKIRLTSTVLLVFALLEHLMSWSSFLYERFFQIRACNWEIGNYFYYIASSHLRQIYTLFPVSIPTVLWAGTDTWQLRFGQ